MSKLILMKDEWEELKKFYTSRLAKYRWKELCLTIIQRISSLWLIRSVVARCRWWCGPTVQHPIINRWSRSPLTIWFIGFYHFNRTISQPNSKLIGFYRMCRNNERVHSLVSTILQLVNQSSSNTKNLVFEREGGCSIYKLKQQAVDCVEF